MYSKSSKTSLCPVHWRIPNASNRACSHYFVLTEYLSIIFKLVYDSNQALGLYCLKHTEDKQHSHWGSTRCLFSVCEPVGFRAAYSWGVIHRRTAANSGYELPTLCRAETSRNNTANLMASFTRQLDETILNSQSLQQWLPVSNLNSSSSLSWYSVSWLTHGKLWAKAIETSSTWFCRCHSHHHYLFYFIFLKLWGSSQGFDTLAKGSIMELQPISSNKSLPGKDFQNISNRRFTSFSSWILSRAGFIRVEYLVLFPVVG